LHRWATWWPHAFTGGAAGAADQCLGNAVRCRCCRPGCPRERQRFSFDASWPYVASLLYLSLFGSALAFGAYLTLMRRIGADRASYTAVAIPVVALLLSSVFEQLRWQFETFAGVALCVAGNVLMLRRRPG
jgi:drug/metabolite transporter (DMT)-like permease